MVAGAIFSCFFGLAGWFRFLLSYRSAAERRRLHINLMKPSQSFFGKSVCVCTSCDRLPTVFLFHMSKLLIDCNVCVYRPVGMKWSKEVLLSFRWQRAESQSL